MELGTERLLLRDFVDGDWRALHEIEGDPVVARYQSYAPKAELEVRAYIRDALLAAAAMPRRLFDLALTLREDGRFIGRVGLNVVNPELREACVWYVLDPREWNKGYVTEAMRPLIDYGFRVLDLHRVWGDCDPRNPGSARVLEKLGMRREAHHVENVFLKGEWCDSLIYAVLAREWPRSSP